MCRTGAVAGVRKPEDLVAWQLSWELKERVHAFTETGPASRDFKFRDATREAALITFLVTLSGVSLAGIGSAFWGVVAGALALFVQQWRPGRASRGPTQ